jgi:hypothetical protein
MNSKTNKEFVPYEEALTLKNLGFDEPCLGKWLEGSLDFPNPDFLECQKKVAYIYNGSILAPLYQQAFRWFIEKYKLYGTIRYGYNEFADIVYLFPCVNGVIVGNDSFRTIEETELACFKEIIEMIKEEKENG